MYSFCTRSTYFIILSISYYVKVRGIFLSFQKYVLFVRNENSFKPSNINKKKFDNVNYCLIYVTSGIKNDFDDLQCNSRSELSSV